MKSVEKIKTQKLVTRIESGNFDENDVDSLFMKLRAYSYGFSVFREIADFVAHNDNRDRGLAKQSLENMYLSMRFFLEFNATKKSLDLSKPFPIWIKKLMILQVGKCEKGALKEKFNVNPERLVKRIKKHFKEDAESGLVIWSKEGINGNTLKAIQYVMSFISGRAAFTQDDLIQDLIGVLKKNRIDFDPLVFEGLSDKITVCVLLLLHKTQFEIGGHKTAFCSVAAEKSCIPHNVQYVDTNGNPVDHHEFFGSLSVTGTVFVERDGKDLGVSHSVMSTNLDAETWCSQKLMRIEPWADDNPNSLCKKLDLDDDLMVDEDFKLAPSPR